MALDFEYISSKENKLLKSVRKLTASSKERKEQRAFVLEGLRLCADAALNGYSVDTVIVSNSLKSSERAETVISSARKRVRVPESLFASLCDTVNPQGILCIVKMPDSIPIESVRDGKYIVLENTADPSNLGAIARTAEAFGISGIIVSSSGCDPFSPKSQRAGMGALLRLPVLRSNDVLSDMAVLREKGFKLFASVVRNADCFVTEADYSGSCAVLIGNEANGLSDEAVALCDMKVTIPMSGRAESLNAAAAASVMMWEMTRSGAEQ